MSRALSGTPSRPTPRVDNKPPIANLREVLEAALGQDVSVDSIAHIVVDKLYRSGGRTTADALIQEVGKHPMHAEAMRRDRVGKTEEVFKILRSLRAEGTGVITLAERHQLRENNIYQLHGDFRELCPIPLEFIKMPKGPGRPVERQPSAPLPRQSPDTATTSARPISAAIFSTQRISGVPSSEAIATGSQQTPSAAPSAPPVTITTGRPFVDRRSEVLKAELADDIGRFVAYLPLAYATLAFIYGPHAPQLGINVSNTDPAKDPTAGDKKLLSVVFAHGVLTPRTNDTIAASPNMVRRVFDNLIGFGESIQHLVRTAEKSGIVVSALKDFAGKYPYVHSIGNDKDSRQPKLVDSDGAVDTLQALRFIQETLGNPNLMFDLRKAIVELDTVTLKKGYKEAMAFFRVWHIEAAKDLVERVKNGGQLSGDDAVLLVQLRSDHAFCSGMDHRIRRVLDNLTEAGSNKNALKEAASSGFETLMKLRDSQLVILKGKPHPLVGSRTIILK